MDAQVSCVCARRDRQRLLYICSFFTAACKITYRLLKRSRALTSSLDQCGATLFPAARGRPEGSFQRPAHARHYSAAHEPAFCFLYFFSAGDGGLLRFIYLFRIFKNTKLTHGSEKCISE